ncbi:MAG: hypothetical protein Q8L94_17055 [Parvibaculum sp.]|uniref:hypothetical protein n=1 Tax=Parvibaculum sp. TaxID=2024848 RepID=UPI002730AEEC|nr:hypothetical protein [Parvibaculum sp.]MDP1628827.1 hypothetical protein [Parvibaculum sp.]MDP2148222.1 hypothetical protein [Parvibaculum sp.]
MVRSFPHYTARRKEAALKAKPAREAARQGCDWAALAEELRRERAEWGRLGLLAAPLRRPDEPDAGEPA